MNFNWLGLLRAYSIEYVEAGPNVAHGNVNIACPLCGDDPSHHLGLNLTTGHWGCWRNKDHRGKSPVRLIQALLNCTRKEAIRLSQQNTIQPNPGDISKIDFNKSVQRGSLDSLQKLYDSFRRISSDDAATRGAFSYLEQGRQYYDHTRKVIRDYGLRYALSGQYGKRIIMPIKDRDGRVVSFTGRHISKQGEPRYLDIEKGRSFTPPKDCLYNADRAEQGGSVLVVCEGPFDAISVDVTGSPRGIHAVALFTISMSEAQQYALFELADKYDKMVVIFDQGADAQAMIVAKQLKPFANARMLSLGMSYKVKDLGEMHMCPSLATFQTLLLEIGESNAEVPTTIRRRTRRMDG
jgi:hypothetical protein